MELFGEIPVAVLEQDRSVIFGLDSGLHIVYCNGAWDHFAAANGGSELLRPAPIGRLLLDSISGPLRPYYESAYHDVLRTSQPWTHIYECSSPAAYRRLSMRVLTMKKTGGLLVVNSLCVERPHAGSANRPCESEYRHQNGILVMCSHCRRTRRVDNSQVWDWVPEYVERMPTRASHGLCDICLQYHYPE
jgi:hypothetical protein